MPKIVSVGSINTDLVTYTPRFPLPGETLTGTSFSSCPGGKGANQCVIAAKLSSTPNYAGMIGCVGSDAYGVAQLSNFATLNADTAHLITCPDPDISSGLATISIDEAGENSIIIIPGANNYLSQDHIADIPPEYFADTTHALFQFEILPSTNMAAMSLIKTSNPTTTTICNPAPALPLSTFPPNFFQHCDILAPNQTELSLLTDNAPSTSVAECVAAAQTLLTTPSTGLSNIIVTMGALGSLLVTPTTHTHVPSPPPPGPVIDTVGAGDCFLGSLTFFLSKGAPIVKAMEYANIVAGVSVTRKGAQGSYPNWREMQGMDWGIDWAAFE